MAKTVTVTSLQALCPLPFHVPTLQPPLCLLVCATGQGVLVLNHLLHCGAAMGTLLFLLPGMLAGSAVPGWPQRWGGGWMLAQKWPWGCQGDISGEVRKA